LPFKRSGIEKDVTSVRQFLITTVLNNTIPICLLKEVDEYVMGALNPMG
jgi:hypothetical protein